MFIEKGMRLNLFAPAERYVATEHCAPLERKRFAAKAIDIWPLCGQGVAMRIAQLGMM